MDDSSYLDSRYFIDPDVYNCPFCNRRNVVYENLGFRQFDWSTTKKCDAWQVRCSSCKNVSMHLTFLVVHDKMYSDPKFDADVDLDAAFFYSVPTSFFVIDSRIPNILRELITEAEACVKMNLLTGASACTRKAIYELLVLQKAAGDSYEDRIKALRDAHPEVDAELFEVLGHIQGMTSEKVHEQSWDAWDSKHLHLFLEAFRAVLHEIYVVPEEKRKRASEVRALRETITKAKSREGAEPPGGVRLT